MLVTFFLLFAVAAQAPAAQPAPPGASATVKAADQALSAGPFSVMQKTRVPPSGDKHDFLTLAPYWWPDPNKPGGLPYIRRDGEVNPESKRGTDDEAFGRMNTAVFVLAQAYRETKDERYAARAGLLLRAWFLDPATRMNPNLTYGQAVPGRNDGRGAGIIATRRLVRIVEAERVIAASPSWTAADHSGLVSWCAAYAAWLQTSPNGREEAAARNNHGTWYDAQLVALLLHTGQKAEAVRVLETQTRKRLATQIQPDGRQPEELARTKSWGYSVMNLDGWFAVAGLAREAGVDLWNFKTSDGRSIRAALDYLVPFAAGDAQWPHQQIAPPTNDELVPLLRQAAESWGAPAYSVLADRLAARAPAGR